VNKKMLPLLPLCLMLGLLASGCAGPKNAEVAETPAVQQEMQKNEPLMYEGEIAGVSERAKTVSITVGKGEQAKVMMVKFDDKTKGVNQAAKGRAVQITYEMRDKDAYATDIQLKLAKLPAGTTEIKTPELQQLIDEKKPFFLVDSRPTIRYDQSHLPEAHSIPVPLLEKKGAAVLPKDKDMPIVFYCGGPT